MEAKIKRIAMFLTFVMLVSSLGMNPLFANTAISDSPAELSIQEVSRIFSDSSINIAQLDTQEMAVVHGVFWVVMW